MRALLDINVLIALFDTAHPFNPTAANWGLANRSHGGAGCPLSRHGFLRIVTHKSYPRPVPLPDAMHALRLKVAEPAHEFWPDESSILDARHIDRSRILSASQLSDGCLLALAVGNGGCLVTSNRGIAISAVQGAMPDHCVNL